MFLFIGIVGGYYLGAKIGNEIFRYKYPESKYQPPPFFDPRLNSI
jgi:hypothetical protein